MSASRFFLDSIEDDILSIVGADAVHALKALRITKGEIVEISDGCGNVATCEVIETSRDLKAAVKDRFVVERAKPSVVVYQGIPKSSKLDEIVKALTQAGVDEIVPVAMRRSVARWDERKALVQLQRLNAIAHDASMQSRRAWLPRVSTPIDVSRVPADVIACTETASRRLTEALPANAPDIVSILIGPEGGIEERFENEVSLGPTVFRTETAALVAVTLVLGRYRVLG
ncbi:MAG: RsmE family RNA methyltransferase [Actinomycetota bacterium]